MLLNIFLGFFAAALVVGIVWGHILGWRSSEEEKEKIKDESRYW